MWDDMKNKNIEDNINMIEASALCNGIAYGMPRSFIKNNRLKMHGKTMVRKSTRRKQKYVTGLFRLRH